jgi:hypothetical protein
MGLLTILGGIEPLLMSFEVISNVNRGNSSREPNKTMYKKKIRRICTDGILSTDNAKEIKFSLC